jgi:hypothetical protein
VAANQSVGTQGGQDVDQELRWYALRLGQVIGFDEDAFGDRRQLHHGPDGVLRLGGHPHGPNSAISDLHRDDLLFARKFAGMPRLDDKTRHEP